LFTVLEQVLPRLGEVHLHDGPWQGAQRQIGYGKDHAPLGTGDLDTARLLTRLQAAGFSGPIVFELTIPQALESLAHIHELDPGFVD
jgi:sugar phosphate isomerase/epimerase